MEQRQKWYSSTFRPGPNKILNLFSHPLDHIYAARNKGLQNGGMTQWKKLTFLSHLLEENHPNSIRMWLKWEVNLHCLKP